ncbi:hypothetical protein STOPSMEL_19 [Sinorhizobium phage StopSmel]|nr:hypothetical protein STOPSMEL_19 [Sinorhizobium phage StopSmel]
MMVAYSFKPIFEPQVASGIKLQTVRGQRRRHARLGEAVQLYVGLRTRFCRKIVHPDPICTDTLPIVIETSSLIDSIIAAIDINGRQLHRDEIEEFARDDGFAPERINGLALDMIGKTARDNMGAFWKANHAIGRFSGELIKWTPRGA